MAVKLIANDWGAWTAGATWQTNQLGNTQSQFVSNFVNAGSTTVYTGDVVIVGSASTVPDPTAVNITPITTAQSPYTIGIVGGETNMAYAGGPIPAQTPPTRIDTNTTTALSATVTDAQTIASDIGKGVTGPGIPAGAYILSVTPGTSFVMSVAATVAASGVTLYIGPRQSSVGPGWLAVPVGEVCPVILSGWGYVNVGTNTVAAGAVLASSTTPRVAAVPGTPSDGTNIAVALEPQNGPGVITSGDGTANVLVRSWITKF